VGRSQLIAGIILGILISGVLIAIAIFITVRIPVAIGESPIQYTDLNVQSPSIVCAGDTITFSLKLHFREPSVVKTYLSIRDADDGRNVPGTQSETGVRPQPQAIEFTDTISFVVPIILPPGNYQHVRSTVSMNVDTKPAFLIVPFTVKECQR
jgi:hypothetical protein